MSKLGTIGFDNYNLDTFPSGHYFIKLQNWINNNIKKEKFFNYFVTNGLPIHFDNRYTSIGINFSGGTDSTMLLYLLAKFIKKSNLKTKIFPISVIRFYDLDNFSETTRQNILDYIQDCFPDIIQPSIVGFLPPVFEQISVKDIQLQNTDLDQTKFLVSANATADVIYFHYFTDWASKKYNLSAIYDGTTTNPTNTDKIVGPPAFRNEIKNLDDYVPTIYRFPHTPNFISVSPFERIEKSWVIAQYYNFNIVDLLNMTQSCSVAKGGCNNLKECFHCSERAWAFENKFYFLEDRKL